MNQPQSKALYRILTLIDCECQCPFCFNPQTNLLDIQTQLVVGYQQSGTPDIKEEEQEDEIENDVEDGDNTAMKVTVEEDMTSNTPAVQIVSQKPQMQSCKAVRKANHLSNYDLSHGETSLQNHLSIRDLSSP